MPALCEYTLRPKRPRSAERFSVDETVRGCHFSQPPARNVKPGRAFSAAPRDNSVYAADFAMARTTRAMFSSVGFPLGASMR